MVLFHVATDLEYSCRLLFFAKTNTQHQRTDKRSQPDFTVLLADKSNATGVMDTPDYKHTLVELQSNDTTKYD